MLKGRIIVGIVFLFCPVSFTAQDYEARKISISEGLSSNDVRDMHLDSYGYLWIGTNHGLNQFDGSHIEKFRHIPGNKKTLYANSLIRIFEDAQGEIWLTHTVGGISSYDRHSSSFEYYPFPDSLKINPLEVLRSEEHLYLLCIKGLFSLDLNTRIFSEIWKNPTRNLESPVRDQNDHLFFKTGNKIFQFSPKSGIQQLPSPFKDCRGLFLNRKGELFGIYDLNISKFKSEKNTWEEVFSLPMDEGISFLGLTMNKNEALIAGLSNGKTLHLDSCFQILDTLSLSAYNLILTNHNLEPLIVRQAEGQWSIYGIKNQENLAQFYLENRPRVVEFSPTQDLIFGGRKGLEIFSPSKVTFKKISGTPFSKVIIGTQVFNDTLFYGYDNHIVGYHSNTHKVTFSSLKHFKGQAIQDFLFHNDLMWVQTNKALWQLKNGEWQTFYLPDVPGKDFFMARSLTLTKENHLCIGSNIGFFYFDGFSLNAVQLYHEKLPDAESIVVNSVLEEQINDYWLGTQKYGLWQAKKRAKRWQFTNYPYPKKDSTFQSATINCISRSEQYLWIGTFSAGLLKFDLKTRTFLDFDDQLPLLPNISKILIRDKNELWISYLEGIAYYNVLTQELIKEKKDMVYPRHPTLYRDSIFFCDDSVINKIIPDYFFAKDEELPIYIQKIWVNSQPNPWHPERKELLLRPNQNHIRIEYSAIDFSPSSYHEYEYKMEGIEDKWVYNGVQKSVTLTNLPPGVFTFEVRLRNRKTTYPITIKIAKPLIQRPVFKLAFLVFLGIVTFCVYKVRQKNAQKRQMELDAIRKNAAADFHDELGNKLSRVTYFSEVLKGHIPKNDYQALDYLHHLQDTSKSLNTSMYDLLWTLKTDQNSIEDLMILLKDFGEDLFSNTGIIFRSEIRGAKAEKHKLSLDKKRHLIFIFKEAMTNILKHSQAKNVWFRLERDQKSFKIILIDDGVGLDHKLNSPGQGLINIQSRAEKVNCELNIQTTTEEGTTIILSGI